MPDTIELPVRERPFALLDQAALAPGELRRAP